MDDLLVKIKDRISEKDSPIKTVKGVATAIGMSEGGFYRMVQRGTTKYASMVALAKALNVDESYLTGKSDINVSTEDRMPIRPALGDPGALERVLQDMHEMKQMFEEQLRAKDAQIAGLLKTVDTLAGKYEGADFDQLLTATGDTDIDLPKYQLGTFMKTILPIFLSQSVTK